MATTSRLLRRNPISIVSLVLALGLLAGACTASSDEALSEPESGMTTTTVAAFAGETAEGDRTVAPGPSEGSGAVLASLQTSNFGRDIIFRADMTIAVTDVLKAGAEATARIQAIGGFVFGQQSSSTPTPTTVLTFKVAPDDFQTAIARLADLGEVRTQTISADDVTERVVDLESRINTAEASVERLRSLLAGADSIDTIATLENQLLERETQLETLRGQLRTVQGQVALATVVVTFTEAASSPGIDVALTAYPGHDDAGRSCPGQGQLAVDEGGPATLCFEIINAGDTALTSLTFGDPVLDLEASDLIAVFGGLGETLQPGDSIVLAAEITLERDLRTRTRVSAVPLDRDGNPQPERTVATTAGLFLDAVDPGGLPGFADGLEASWSLLRTLGGVAVLIAGAALPFVWLLLAGALYVMWSRRRQRPEPTNLEPIA